MKLFTSITVALMLTLILAVIPAAASAPQGVMIVSDMICVDDICTGDFTASGPAVNAGLLCGTGYVTDNIIDASGYQSGKFVILNIHKLFECSDGSGTFEMDMMVRLSGGTIARWVISGGTDAYAGLSGSGSLTGAPVNNGTIQDVYWGKIQNH